jgi:hypothetical protein
MIRWHEALFPTAIAALALVPRSTLRQRRTHMRQNKSGFHNRRTYSLPSRRYSDRHRKYDGTLDLICPEGQAIDVQAFLFRHSSRKPQCSCLHTQSTAQDRTHHSSVEIGTSGGKDDLTVQVSITNIKYEKTRSCGASAGEDAKLQGTITWSRKMRPVNPTTYGSATEARVRRTARAPCAQTALAGKTDIPGTPHDLLFNIS